MRLVYDNETGSRNQHAEADAMMTYIGVPYTAAGVKPSLGDMDIKLDMDNIPWNMGGIGGRRKVRCLGKTLLYGIDRSFRNEIELLWSRIVGEWVPVSW